MGDTAYDSYISETLYPLNWRVPSSPRSRWGLHGTQWPMSRPYLQGGQDHTLPKGPSMQETWTWWNQELSQARADMNLNRDLRGNLPVMSPRESHLSEETLPTVPLGQFQAQQSDNTTTNSIAHSDIKTPSQSEIFSDHNNSSRINENIVTSRTTTSFQREIFSEAGTGTSSNEDLTHSDADMSEEAPHQIWTECNYEEASDNSSTSRTTTSSQSEIFSSYNNNSDFDTYTTSQSEISEYNVNSESSSRETSRPSSPEPGNLTTRTLYSALPEMAIVHTSLHDAIHAVREQHGRAVTRSLLKQHKVLAANKLQCNAQIKRTSTPDPPSMSNVPPRWARARLEKANGVTSGSSEESECEPQTARKARFEALKRQFKTSTKSKKETP